MKVFLLLAAAAPLFAQTCTFTPAFTTFTTGGAGVPGGLNLQVATQQGCPWTATSSVPWIHILNAQTYVSSQSVAFTIDTNTTTQVRTGSITVGSVTTQQTVTFTQTAGDCGFQIVPPVSTSYPVGGGSGSFNVTAGCNWNAGANVGWLTVTAPTVLGNGTVTYTALPNTCVAPRTGTITVNTGLQSPPPPIFTISEDGSQANLTLGAASASFGPAATNGRVQVNTGDGCSWSSFSDNSWLQISNNTGAGNGPGFVTFNVTQNQGAQRIAHITVGTQVFTVTQASAAGPPAPVISAIINSASGASGPISPGEIVSIFGSNMGPAVGVAFGQTIPFNLAGVQVMFGNTAAPLTYVSASQINAVVPYGIAGTTTQIQVQYQQQNSNTLTAAVQLATPAIFSADMSGHGPGAILNSDYKLNTTVNPASAGSVVMIYATGGGVTTPVSADGSLAPSAEPFARLLAPVTVTIGGAQAQVLYAGGAPGLISGLTQINVIVPGGITPGASVPMIVQVGGYQSQTGLTIALN